MRVDLASAQHEYQTKGFCVVDDVIPQKQAKKLAVLALHLCEIGLSQHVEGARGGPLDEGEPYLYEIIDALECIRSAPELLGIYSGLMGLVSAISGEDIALSPYPRSAVGLKVHQGRGSTHGYHRDTNPISALLYLTDNTGGATRLHPLNNPARALRVVPQCGRMLLMRGREIRHCGESLTDAQVKIVAPLNYYTAQDKWRPEGIDALVYGG